MVGRLIRKGPQAKLVLSVTMINRAVAVTFDAADVRKYLTRQSPDRVP